MASSKEFLDYVLEQVSNSDDVTYRKMMGEYVLYYRGRIVGGIYDDRLLVKPVASALAYMPDATYELPYDGAKEMLLVDRIEEKDFVIGLFRQMCEDLPDRKEKKKK